MNETLKKLALLAGWAVLQAGCVTAAPDAALRFDYADRRTYRELAKPCPDFGALTNEVVTLSNRFGTARISLVGANVFSYVPAGGRDVFFLAEKHADFTSGQFVHGGVPVVWPWFNMNGDAGSMQHGFARCAPWKVVEKAETPDVSRLTLELVSTDETRRIWPYDFRLTYVITLSEQLQLSLVVRNTGKLSFSMTEGFHSYFRVSDVDTVVLRGLNNCRNETFDVTTNEREVFKGDLKWTAGEGRVFSPSWSGEYVLFDEGYGRALAIAARGHRKMTLWSVTSEDRDPQFGADDWKHFACVEPSTLCRESAITVAPGKEYELRMSVKAVSL